MQMPFVQKREDEEGEQKDECRRVTEGDVSFSLVEKDSICVSRGVGETTAQSTDEGFAQSRGSSRTECAIMSQRRGLEGRAALTLMLLLSVKAMMILIMPWSPWTQFVVCFPRCAQMEERNGERSTKTQPRHNVVLFRVVWGCFVVERFVDSDVFSVGTRLDGHVHD